MCVKKGLEREIDPRPGGAAGSLGGNDGHEVNRRPGVGAVHLQQIKTGWSHGANKQVRVKNKGHKLMKSQGNERRSERGGQPLGPLEIKAPLTLVGVPARISEGDPLGRYRGTIVSATDGRPIGRNSHHWGRRRRPERTRDRLVPVTPKWTGDRWATRTRGVQETAVTPLSPLAESFTPQPTSEERQTQPLHTDNDLDLARTGSSEIETPRDSIKCKIATIGTACPIEIGKPVAMADVAEPRGPAGTGTGGPVVAGTRFTAVTDRTGASGLRRSETGEPVVTGKLFHTGIDIAEASGPAVTGAGVSVGVGKGFRPVSGIAVAGGLAGTGAGGPVVAGTRFLAVADVYAPFEETEGDPQSDMTKFDQISETITEVRVPTR